jgi:hypothetical protein
MEPPVRKNLLFDTLLPRVEWFAWLLASAGIALAYFSYPRANIFIFFGFSTLATVYFLDAFAPHTYLIDNSFYHQEITTQDKSFLVDKVVPQVQAQAMAATLVGIQFKLLFWPGSHTLLLVGTALLAVVTAIQFYANCFSRKTLVIAALGAIAAYISSDELVRQFYRHDPALAEKIIYHLHHPEDKAAAKEIKRLQQTLPN